MWGQLRKYVPFVAIVGYMAVYMNKGWDRILIDLKSMTLPKLQSKWQNFLIAGIAAVGIYIISKVKMPVAFKVLALLILYFVIGYNVATAIDPPNGNSPQYYNYTGNERNPYALGRR